MIYNQGYDTNYYDLYCEEKKRFKNVFFYWQCSLILGVATLVIFILLGFGPVDYYVTARPLITKSCEVGDCRKKGTQCFRLKAAAAVTAWTFLLTLLLRALSCWSYGAVHCSNRINECYFTKKKCRRSVSLSKSRNSRGKSENICCVNNALNELCRISINR